jgi:hypothetical protein
MKIVRGKGDKVMILRNKRKGLRLLVIEDNTLKISVCKNDCYLWNNPLCNKKPCGKVGLWGRIYHFVKDQ